MRHRAPRPVRARPRRSARRCVLAGLVATSVVVAVVVTPPSRARADTPVDYVPPVDAEVVDGFRAPEHRYGPGNRGLEYATDAGTPVLAAADGRVTFAGWVAGTRHVTVLHADGVRTSYSYLAEVSVVVGQAVVQGQQVGVAGERLHLGARLGAAYLDPAALFDGTASSVRLVPFEEPPREGAAGERSALRQLVGAAGSALGAAVDSAGSLASFLRSDGAHLVRTAVHYGVGGPAGTLSGALAVGASVQTAHEVVRRPCSGPNVVTGVPGERRIAVLVGGLGSTSEHAGIDEVDTRALGYDPGDVLRFSYAGGRTPDTTDGFTQIRASPYGASDTAGDLTVAGARLAELVEAVATEAPGAPIDLYAHSQGGLVVRLALEDHTERGRPHPIGVVATLGTPHGGADVATALHGTGNTRAGAAAIAIADEALDLGGQTHHAAEQLSETSDVVRHLADVPLPEGTTAVSVAARGDVIVPVPRTTLEGATSVVVPLTGIYAHDELPGAPHTTRALGLALAGLPPPCQTFGDALVDQLVGEGVSRAQDAAGVAAWLVAGALG